MILPYKKGNKIILHGNDTDVSWVTWVKMSPSIYVITTLWKNDDEPQKSITTSQIKNEQELVAEYELQLGSPMQYLDKSTFLEFLKQ